MRTPRPLRIMAKALTFNLSAPFGSPFDQSLSNTGQHPLVPLSTGALYEAAAPAQAVVGTLARGVARAQLRVVFHGSDGSATTVRDDRLERALNDPELKAALASDLSIYGRAFALVVNGSTFVRLPADTTQVLVQGLEVTGYRNNGNEYGVHEVAFARHYSPLTTKAARGGSPLEAARPELEEYLAAWREARALASGASTVVKRSLDAPEWSENAAKRFEEGWGSRLKAGGSPVLEDGMELGLVPRPPAFVEARRLAFDVCCSIYSVPATMVPGATSDRNADSGARSFAVDAVQPVGDLLAAAMTRVAVPLFYADNAYVSRIAVVCNVDDLGRDRFAQRMLAYRAAVGDAAGQPEILTPDECRALEGLGPKGGA